MIQAERKLVWSGVAPRHLKPIDDKLVRNVILLMRDNYESVGFLPEGEVREAIATGRLYSQVDNDDWVGYLIRGPIRGSCPVRIKQECIDKAARRYGSGRRCFEQLLYDAVAGWSSSIRLRCADGLESNWFWQSLGFRIVGVDTTPNTRKRNINYYEKPLLMPLVALQPGDAR